MAVATYIREERLPEVLADEGRTLLEERHELLSDTGFDAVWDFEIDCTPRIERAELLYPEMQGVELGTWRTFLPTVVGLKHYRFDQPPSEALEAIKTAQDLGCFDRIVIWTPEGNDFRATIGRSFKLQQKRFEDFMARIDPMAVGVIADVNGNDRFFQIVRWGESLLPFEQIKRQVATLTMKVRLTAWLANVAVIMAVSALVAATLRFGLIGFCLAGLGLIGAGIIAAFAAEIVSPEQAR